MVVTMILAESAASPEWHCLWGQRGVAGCAWLAPHV